MQVGWDWASASHDVTVLDDAGGLVDRFALAHDEAGIKDALERLAGLGDPSELSVAIETTSGVVVDRLLAAGHPVVPIFPGRGSDHVLTARFSPLFHPNAFNAARPRWGASKAKSDPGDSYKLADYLRTDGHRLRTLKPIDDKTAGLRALVRMRDDHAGAKMAATNQLASWLDRHWPG